VRAVVPQGPFPSTAALNRRSNGADSTDTRRDGILTASMPADREHGSATPEEWSSNATEKPAKSSTRPLKIALVVLGCGCMSVMGLGLLATILVPNVLQKLGEAQHMKSIVDLRRLDDALAQYTTDNAGSAPESLEALTRPDPDGKPYVERIPLDAWDRPYVFERATEPYGRCRVTTYGRDGKPGGEGADRDVNNFALTPR
jgi:general secretion pathway protein G